MRTGHARRWCLLGSLAAVLAAAILATLAVTRQRTVAPIGVTIDFRHRRPAVAQRFAGLSFEMSSLPLIARYAHHGDFVSLLRSLGPGLMRFGGISGDSTVFAERTSRAALWPATVITREDLSDLGELTRRTNWRVLLSVDLVHYDPRAAALEVGTAYKHLGARLAGVEIGNEPDAYGRHGVRPASWRFAEYARQVEAYRRAIQAVAPHVKVVGPDVSGSGGGAIAHWVRPEAIRMRPMLLTGHYYSLGCHDKAPPTITRLLSPKTSAGMKRSLDAYMAVSRAIGIPFRVDEANDVSCAGEAGISNTFASALWAVGYLIRAMDAGVAGVNLHAHLEDCGGYAPLCAPSKSRLLAGELHVQPEWYALLFVRPLVGTHPVQAVISHPRPDITVRAFSAHTGRARVVIVDTAAAGTPPADIHVSTATRFSRASTVTLAAPSRSATSGVTLGGRSVADDKAWREPRPHQVPIRQDQATLSVSSDSATLLTLSR
jgi:hypothetical protein